MMPVVYPGNDKLFTYRNTCSTPHPHPTLPFDVNAVPRLTRKKMLLTLNMVQKMYKISSSHKRPEVTSENGSLFT